MYMADQGDRVEKKDSKSIHPIMPHYYGDTVRKLFMLESILMIITIPLFFRYIAVSVIVAMIGTLILGLAAAWTSPAQKVVAIANTVIAGFATMIFEYYASVDPLLQITDGYEVAFRLLNLAFAVISFLAFYYGVKTVRGYFFKK